MSNTSKPTPVGQQATDVQIPTLAGAQFGNDGKTVVGQSNPGGNAQPAAARAPVRIPRGQDGAAAPNI
jgi:hypothetical protein